MMEENKIVHSSEKKLRSQIDIVLVRPEVSQNVGAATRALANMGINGSLLIVGNPTIIDHSCRKLAKHAGHRLDTILFCDSFAIALEKLNRTSHSLVLAATARIGSPHRPHPIPVADAVKNSIQRLSLGLSDRLIFVFGPESDGLDNEEILLCDWVVTIPSSEEYRSLNLAQSVLIFAYEAQKRLLEIGDKGTDAQWGEREKLGLRFVELAETAGFILPGDPFKMKPRLGELFSRLPNNERDARTLHGLCGQVSRSLKAGCADYKGRYKHKVKELAPEKLSETRSN